MTRRRQWMRYLAYGTLLVLVGVATASAQSRAGSLPGLGGGQLTEADLEKGATIIVIWASWSPQSRDIVERVNRIETDWGDGARVMMVNFQEERADVEAFLEGKELAVPVFLDERGAFSKRNAVTSLPGVLIYRDGAVAHRGRLPRDADALIRRILG